MNHVYRIVWSTATSSWVVASELATGDARGARGERRALRRALLLAGIGLALGAPSAWSQTLHWDGNDTNANANGGNGTWNNTLSNWDTAATGGANATWNSALPNDAVFGGAGTVTIDAAGVAARNLTFTGTGYTFTGGPLTLSGTDPTVATNSGATNNFSVVVAGSNGLVKRGLGTLELAGQSAFEDVTVTAGLLHVTAGSALGAQQLAVESAGVLQLDGDFAATDGDDGAIIAGTVTGPGAFGLGNGNDTLELRDGADLSALASPLDGGAGTNTLQTDIATSATLGSVVNFQDLLKTNTGTLAISGPATTAFESVNLQGGTLAIGASGRLDGVASTTVAQGTTLRIEGAYMGTAADDLFVLAGALQGNGVLAFGAGHDTLQLADGASLAMASAIDGGTGNDELVAEVSATTSIGALVDFESLQKHGTGTLRSTASQAFAMADVFEGVLAIDAGTTFTSQATTIAAGATLDIAGAFNGTAGDDTFTTAGSVRGALAFGAGNDRVYVTGGPLLPRQLDGGAGGDDRLTFDGVQLDDASVAGLRGWELMALEGGSQLTLSTTLAGVSRVSLAAGTALFAQPGASIAGTLSNDGAVHADGARLAIGGDYAAGPDALLHVLVSPGQNTAGGLDVAGNITGVTSVVFASDGSTGGGPDPILVIDSPNDIPGDGGFVLGNSPDGFVRVQGSPFAWTFGQADDHRWYLDTRVSQLAPEVPGYGIVGAIAFDALRASQQAVSAHLDAVRGLRDCDRGQAHDDAAVRVQRTDCNGVWMSMIGTETQTGSDPGVAYSGDAYGLYIGVDGTVHEDAGKELRVGGYAGTAKGNYWTTGGDPLLSPEANVRLEGPAFGAYAELAWTQGAYVSASLVHQRQGAEVVASDGFRQRVDGESLSLVHQAGWRLSNGGDWSLVPHVQVGIAETQWDDTSDASGKALDFIDDTTVQLRAALRVERALLSDAGALRPWFTVGLEDTKGEARSTVAIGAVGVPGENLRQRWTFDAGMEATLHAGVSLFGALGVSRELNGTSKETGQARAGVRWTW